MNNKITVLRPRWIVCVDAENRVLSDHAVVIEGECILDITPWNTARNTYTDAEIVELPEQALLPGLINSHTHLAMNLLRGLAEDLPLMTWLNDHIWPAEGKHISHQFVADGARLAIAELLQSGVTCFNDMYFFPEAVAEVALETGIRASVSMIVIDFPTAWANQPSEYLQKGVALHEQLSTEKHVTTMLAPHAPYTACEDTLREVIKLRDKLDLGVHMHVHETAVEVQDYERAHGVRPIEKLHKLGLLDRRMCAVHVTQATEKEIALLAETQTNVLHCPVSNLKLASGIAPISQMLAANNNVAIGTDSAASNNDLDMLGEVRTAGLIAKVSTGDAATVPAAQLLRMATINGARALGMDQITGSIETGKQADLCSLDFNNVTMQPVYDPTSHIVYSASRKDVTNTWVAGRRLLNNRVLVDMNTEDLIANAREWSDRIAAPNEP